MSYPMVKDINSVDDTYTAKLQAELLQLLLEKEVNYPWNTADPESEIYFASQEQDFMLEEWSEAEIAMRSQTFFTKLEQTWSTIIKDVPETE